MTLLSCAPDHRHIPACSASLFVFVFVRWWVVEWG